MKNTDRINIAKERSLETVTGRESERETRFEEHEQRSQRVRFAETKEPISSQSEGWLDTGTSWFRGRLSHAYIKLNHTSNRYSHRDAIIQYFEANPSTTMRPICENSDNMSYRIETRLNGIFQVVVVLIRRPWNFHMR